MRLTRMAAVLAAMLGLAGCAQAVEQHEDLLAAAGFRFKQADTPARVASLRTLPPHHFVHEQHDGRSLWVYADPTICGCLYVGDQAAFQRYQQEVFAQQITNQQEMTAEMNATMPYAGLEWGPWGPWAPYSY